MAEAMSDQDVLYVIFGGLQPGGTCLAWIAGLVACEAIRLTQRFGDDTPWIKRLFVYLVLFLSVALASLFGAMVYYYGVESNGNYEALNYVPPSLRYHFVCSRIATFAGFLFYSHSVWSSPTGQRKIFRIPIIRIIIVLMNAGLYFICTLRVIRLFRITNFGMFQHSWLWQRPAPAAQLGCGAVVTLIKAYDLWQSNAISKVVVLKGDPFRCAWEVLCLLCQTAIFPTVVDAILVCVIPQDGRVGLAYSIFSLSAEFHLFGPIMAISAELDDDPAECSTPCPVVTGSLNVGDAGGKKKFQSVQTKKKEDVC